MLLHTVLFYVFAAIMFGAALGVVFSRNPVHSVMFLVLTFFNAAVLWLMAEAEFLAIVLVLVYVGAVMVLFLFVVMMLDVNVEAAKRGLTRYAPLGIGIALLMVIELIQVIWLRGQISEAVDGFARYAGGLQQHQGAWRGAVHRACVRVRDCRRHPAAGHRCGDYADDAQAPGLKVQDISAQVAVRAKDRVRIVKMDAEKKP